MQGIMGSPGKIFRTVREETPPTNHLWTFGKPTKRALADGKTDITWKAPSGEVKKQYPSGALHGMFHQEQGHSPQWGEDEMSLTTKEMKRAQKRFRRNRGCLYQSCSESEHEKRKKAPPQCEELDLNLKTLFPSPMNTLYGTLHKVQKDARREGWGGLASRREYKPVYVPRYGTGPKGKPERISMEDVRKAEAEKRRSMKDNHPDIHRKKNWLPAPSCFDPEFETRGEGEVGPIGRLEPSGWWVARDNPVLTAPHHYHRDTRPGV